MNISSQKKSDAISTLEMAIEAAKNSNSDGERAVMAAASGLRLLGALKRLMPELRRMHADRIISKEQFSDAERGIAAAEGRDVAVASGSVPQPTIPKETQAALIELHQMGFYLGGGPGSML